MLVSFCVYTKNFNRFFQSGRYVALADYCAVGNSEVNMREGDVVELLKVGCAGWWFVKVIGKKICCFVTLIMTNFLQVIRWKVGLLPLIWRISIVKPPAVLVVVKTG